ncbi:MAG TPA: hypothetical protein VH701_10725 [Vicinamibacterales bacterium]|jgi:hypothetical protein
MTEEELRGIVRDAVARHLSGERGNVLHRWREGEGLAARSLVQHASHVRLAVLAGDAVGDGACLIEPAVGCNHCGYCQSYGH